MSRLQFVRGTAAVEFMQKGAIGLVFNDQKGWVFGGEGVLSRALRTPTDALWIYGAILRADLETLVWRHTHRDYKGTRDGTRCVLHLQNGGTWSVPLSTLSDEELFDKLPSKGRAVLRAQIGEDA